MSKVKESVIMKYAGEFMILGDQSQYFAERTKKMQACLGIININITGLDYFANPITDEEQPKDLHERLRRLQDGVVRSREKLLEYHPNVAKEMGLIARLEELQNAIEDAKFQVRREIHH